MVKILGKQNHKESWWEFRMMWDVAILEGHQVYTFASQFSKSDMTEVT